MRRRFFLIALVAIASALSFNGKAGAADCGNCGYSGYYHNNHYYAVQPKVVVRHPLVVLEPYYVTEYVPCGNGYVVNQGQYRTTAAVIAKPSCFPGYGPAMYVK